ncbi:ERI1 exoribonuclease 2-like isoform X2 [Mangifera indica]|uniref:ERI1 exoribonuclease 2-like isoform X2 n=1 Tax=Mangifera indica TaxID=29780 RepID=UPI001CF9906E|nr:ERI1 exoribonuclease 2-like isoform X2 [Mangifera indica]XP_044483352.1 ERI1 exoribonuclease 2-like isoform X2 [Mangifera indica]XP_044483353.1 ERI1 exoribonuclease 2-like isoform X2 [Mangifera indica]
MAVEFQETMQKYCGAPVRCLQNKVYPYNLQYSGNHVEGLSEPKDGINSNSGGGFMHHDSSFSSMSFIVPNGSYYRPGNQQEYYAWLAFQHDIHKAQQNHFHALEGHFHPVNSACYFHMNNQFQYVPFQEFQYFIVIDFEATCDKERNPHPQEIIEFPSVIVNSSTGQLEDYFQIYVRPTYNQHLSDFCKELTGIQQTQVDKGVLLSEALLLHDQWLEDKGIKQTNFAVVTWSNWDCRVILESECRFKRIRKPPYFNRWINLKVPFHEVFGGVKCNLKEAVELAGLVWEGRAHCGLDDAKNTACLLAHLMHRGFRFTITNSLVWQSVEHPLTMQPFLDRQSSSTQQPYRTKHHHSLPFVQFHPVQAVPNKDHCMYCFCGVKTSRQMIRKPGPKQGSFFFGCGNWTATRGALCPISNGLHPELCRRISVIFTYFRSIKYHYLKEKET